MYNTINDAAIDITRYPQNMLIFLTWSILALAIHEYANSCACNRLHATRKIPLSMSESDVDVPVTIPKRRQSSCKQAPRQRNNQTRGALVRAWFPSLQGRASTNSRSKNPSRCAATTAVLLKVEILPLLFAGERKGLCPGGLPARRPSLAHPLDAEPRGDGSPSGDIAGQDKRQDPSRQLRRQRSEFRLAHITVRLE